MMLRVWKNKNILQDKKHSQQYEQLKHRTHIFRCSALTNLPYGMEYWITIEAAMKHFKLFGNKSGVIDMYWQYLSYIMDIINKTLLSFWMSIEVQHMKEKIGFYFIIHFQLIGYFVGYINDQKMETYIFLTDTNFFK